MMTKIIVTKDDSISNKNIETITKNQTINLIEGSFSYEDANDILINVFNAKINFHQLKNFSSQERFGKNDETAQDRISKLKQEITKLKSILSEAKDQNKTLKIHSDIYITISND